MRPTTFTEEVRMRAQDERRRADKESAEREAWRRYHEDTRLYEARMEKTRPKREDFISEDEYDRAFSRWTWEFCVDAPNRPGYEYANNH